MSEVDEGKKFYRYELVVWHERSIRDLVLCTYVVHKETPMGYWIKREDKQDIFCYEPRWIEKRKANKKYARETKKRALECYIIRTNKRVGYLAAQINNAKSGLGLALEMNKEFEEVARKP